MQSESRQPAHCFVVSLGVNPKIKIGSELKLSLNKSAVSNVCLLLDKLETKQLHFSNYNFATSLHWLVGNLEITKECPLTQIPPLHCKTLLALLWGERWDWAFHILFSNSIPYFPIPSIKCIHCYPGIKRTFQRDARLILKDDNKNAFLLRSISLTLFSSLSPSSGHLACFRHFCKSDQQLRHLVLLG